MSLLEGGITIQEATHIRSVMLEDVEKIICVYGVDSHGHLAKPSEGGFGVITESGAHIDMWHAYQYFKDPMLPLPPRTTRDTIVAVSPKLSPRISLDYYDMERFE